MHYQKVRRFVPGRRWKGEDEGITAQLTDGGPNGADSVGAQKPNPAKGATAERRLAVAPFAPFGWCAVFSRALT